MIGVPLPTNARYGYGVGASKTICTVSSSRAWIDAIPSNALFAVHPVASSEQYRHVNTTSSDVTSLPSDHFTPSFSFHVIHIRSCENPPFSIVGMSAASAGTILPSGSYLASGSNVIAAASTSFSPADRYGFGTEGACQ